MHNFYARQIKLPFVGNIGQEKLHRTKVLIIGAGGLGNPCAIYLAGSGIGTIGILDFDKVDITNLHRQIIFTPDDVGKLKAEVLANHIKKQNPYIEINTHYDFLDSENIEAIFCNYEMIIDCCDNLNTKFLIHDFSFKQKKILIQGSIDQIEGELKVFNYLKALENAPCLRCLWEKVPENNCIDSCAEAGVLPTTAGVFGTLMANEVIKVILKTSPLPNGESFFLNLHSLESRKLKWKKKSDCSLCSGKDFIIENLHPFELTHRNVSNLSDFNLIDLRSNTLVPDDIDNKKKYLLFCEKGITSLTHTKILREEGYSNVWSLSGGASCLTFLK